MWPLHGVWGWGVRWVSLCVYERVGGCVPQLLYLGEARRPWDGRGVTLPASSSAASKRGVNWEVNRWADMHKWMEKGGSSHGYCATTRFMKSSTARLASP